MDELLETTKSKNVEKYVEFVETCSSFMLSRLLRKDIIMRDFNTIKVVTKDDYSDAQLRKHKFIRDLISPTFRTAFPAISTMQYKITRYNGFETETIILTYKQADAVGKRSKSINITGYNYATIIVDLLKNLMY